MKLFILNEIFELNNNIESVEEIFDYIKQALEETEYNFSYIIVDGEEVHDEFELYLEDNIKSIDEVKIVMLAIKDMVKDSLFTIYEYVGGAVPIINNLANRFKLGADVEDWKQISELLEGIGFIVYTLESIVYMEDLNDIICDHKVWNAYVSEVKSLDDILKQLNSAIENGDTDLIGKLLSSEIIPVFEKMKEKLDVLVATN